MEKKLINIDTLLKKLKNKYGLEYLLEWVDFGSYNFLFIHRCDNPIYVWISH
jgi:hypothetical protein